MKGIENGLGARLRYARERWKLTQVQLATNARVGVATVRRMEGGKFDPRLSTASKLANTLQVRVEWLLTGDEPMLCLAHMTVDEQRKSRSWPRAESLPPSVILGPGPWFRDDDGEWWVDTREGQDEA